GLDLQSVGSLALALGHDFTASEVADVALAYANGCWSSVSYSVSGEVLSAGSSMAVVDALVTTAAYIRGGETVLDPRPLDAAAPRRRTGGRQRGRQRPGARLRPSDRHDLLGLRVGKPPHGGVGDDRRADLASLPPLGPAPPASAAGTASAAASE